MAEAPITAIALSKKHVYFAYGRGTTSGISRVPRGSASRPHAVSVVIANQGTYPGSTEMLRSMLKAAVGYVRKNPDEVVRQAVSATGLTFGVPLATLRWFAGNLKGKKAPKDVEITSAAPALRFSAVVDAMGTPVRASAAIKIDEVTLSADSVRIAIRLRDVKLALAGEPNESPVATLIQSGALDLSKPGNLVKFIPKRPAAVVEAEGDRIVIDLMKVPKLANDPRVKKILGILSPVLGIRAIETDRDHLWIKLRATPAGLPEAIGKLRTVK